MIEKIERELRPKMMQIIEHLREEFKKLHTGHAQTALVEDLKVSYYGQDTPLQTMASITSPDAQTIVIQPWDKNALGDIELAIRNSNVGLAPINDGRLIRLRLPPLTEERRKELVKLIEVKAESARIALRTVRQEAWEQVQDLERKDQITIDDRYLAEKTFNKMIEEFNNQVEMLATTKEKELMTI